VANPPETTPALSLVIPAYHEAQRLPAYLPSVRSHLDRRYGSAYELIVVDDGGGDDLVARLEDAARDWTQLRWISHPENRGKGAAVRTGVLAAGGRLILFADADGAAPIEEEVRLADAIAAGADVAIGSRTLPSPDIQRERRVLRGCVGRLFAMLARRWLGLSVRDTQCGFKMFRAEVARRLFSTSREVGYLFDLEILVLAARLGYRVDEVPIHWHEVPGGNIHVARDMPRIARDLWNLRRRLGSRA